MNQNAEPIQILFHSKNGIKSNINNSAEVDFYFNTIAGDNQTHIYLKPIHVTIPYSFYQTNSTNNYLRYTINNSITNIYIPEGNYNINDLISYLKLNMNGFTITYNRINNKLTFTHSTNDFLISPFSTCLKFLGLKNTLNSTNRTLQSEFPITVLSTHCICIYTTIHTSFLNTSQGEKIQNLLLTIPIDINPNGVIIYKDNLSSINTNDNLFNSIGFRLCDENGNLLNLNGMEWSILFELQFVDFVSDNI